VKYINPSFTASSLSDGGLALLPVLDVYKQELYAHPFADTLNKEIANHSAQMKFVSWQDAISKINDDSLGDSYQAAISMYQTTSLVDKSLIQRIGKSLGVRYLMLVSLSKYRTISSVGSSLLSKAEPVDSATVSAFARIWDSESGDVMWEATGESEADSGEFTYLPRDFEFYFRSIASALVSKLP